MPPHIVPNNTKVFIPTLYRDGHSIKEICGILGIKKSLVYKTLDFYRRYGVVYNPHTYTHAIGRRRILSLADTAFIRAMVQHRTNIYLDELQHELWDKRQVYATIPTLSQALKRLCLTRKSISFSASERNEDVRARYMNRIGADAPNANMLLFVDEAAKDMRTSTRLHGWSPKGDRCNGKRRFIRGARYSILPCITLDGVISYDIIEGPVDSVRFLRFLTEHVVRIIHTVYGFVLM